MSDLGLELEGGGALQIEGQGALLAGVVRPATPLLTPQSQEDYAAAFLAELPRGRVWPRYAGATMPAIVGALAGTPARVAAAAARLLQEQPAGEMAALLPDWEAALGLPDPCAGAQPTVALRLRSVRAQIAAQGGQSIPYFVGLAAALATPITIDEYQAARCDIACADDPCNGDDWAFAWQINMPPTVVTEIEVESGLADDPLASWGVGTVECTIGRYAPAHTLPRFAYAGDLPAAPLGDFELDFNSLA